MLDFLFSSFTPCSDTIKFFFVVFVIIILIASIDRLVVVAVVAAAVAAAVVVVDDDDDMTCVCRRIIPGSISWLFLLFYVLCSVRGLFRNFVDIFSGW